MGIPAAPVWAVGVPLAFLAVAGIGFAAAAGVRAVRLLGDRVGRHPRLVGVVLASAPALAAAILTAVHDVAALLAAGLGVLTVGGTASWGSVLRSGSPYSARTSARIAGAGIPPSDLYSRRAPGASPYLSARWAAT